MNLSRRGFTIIELIVVIVILGVIAAAGTAFFTPMIRLYFFTPSQSSVQLYGNYIKDTVIEGDSAGKGLRAVRNIVSATSTSVNYFDADDREITITWNGGTQKFTRTTPSGSSNLPTQNPGADIKVSGQSAGTLFRYYDAAQNELSSPVATPSNIARVDLNWTVYSGSGSADNYEGSYRINSGIHIKRAQ